jgi:hypothetical protein
MRSLGRTGALLCLVCMALLDMPAPATARIELTATALDDGTPVIGVNGTFDLSDGLRFEQYASRYKRGVISFRSDGGSIVTAIRIGQYIRSHQWASAVEAGARCASACGLAWLGGEPRLAAGDAEIGFHAAYIIGDDGSPTEAGMGNALVGAYLNRLGLSDKAIMYVTAAPPQNMLWLSTDVAKLLAIDVIEIAPGPGALARGLETAPSEPTSPSTPPSPKTVLPPGNDRSIAFVTRYFETWSKPNAEALAFAESIYPTHLNYYGRLVDVASVMDQKRAFVERWPSRTYKIRDRSITVECNSVTTVCIVSGVVDWTCANPQQRASAKGVASFTLKLSMVAEGRTVIIDENGKLVH